MSDLFGIGGSALRTYRAALQAVGDNIANAQTPGFAKRAISIREIDGRAASPRYGTMQFAGSEAWRVTRSTDAFATIEARRTAALSADATSRAHWSGIMESALGTPGADVGTAIGGIFDAATQLAGSPDDRVTRAGFLDAVAAAAGTIRDTAAALNQAGSGIDDALATITSDANAALTTLADINRALLASVSGTVGAATLADQRDAIIDQLASLIGGRATLDEHGAATVMLDNAIAIDPAGGARVITLTPGGLSIAGNVVAGGGAFAGLIAARDANAARRSDLDVIATGLASMLNTWHGTPLIGGTSADDVQAVMSDPDALAVAGSGAANGNAVALGNLRVSSGLEVRWEALVSAQASMTAAAKTRESALSAQADAASARRDQVEGVDLDQEAAMLLRYQQAYEGAARVIQTARDTVDTILRLFQ